MSAEANKERARDLLKTVVNTVPASLGLASVQKVLEWKAWITKARKALDNERTTDGELMNLYQQLRSY